MFDCVGKPVRIVENVFPRKLAEEGRLHAVNARFLAEMICEGGASARRRQCAFKPREIAVRRKVEFGLGFSISFQRIAERCGEDIDEAPLYAVRADDKITTRAFTCESEGDGFHRRARKALFHMRAPFDIKAAICRAKGRDVDAAFGEQSRPCAVSAEARPACAAKSEHG